MPTGFTTVSAAQLQDSTGSQISNASISFLPVLNNGSPTSFKSGGTAGQTIATAVAVQVVEGAFSIELADTSLTTPINVGYRVTVTDNVSGKVLLAKGYECIQPTGPTWSFDTFVPDLTPQVPYTPGPAGLSAYQIYQASGGMLGETAWLASLQGEPGTNGSNGSTSPNFTAPVVAPFGVSTTTLAVGGTQVSDCATEEGYIEVHTDGHGNVYFAIEKDGSIFPAPSIPGIEQRVVTESGAAFSVLDVNNNVLFEVDANGNQIRNLWQSPGVTTFFTYPKQGFAPFDPAGFTAVKNHVTITGQSNSVGANAFPILSTSAPFSFNWRLGASVNAYTLGQMGVALQALFEQAATSGSGTDGGETVGTSFASSIASLVTADLLSHPLIMSGSGISGDAYSAICGPTDWTGALVGGVNKGSPSFQEMMSQISLGMSLTSGGAYCHRAVVLVHSEQDALIGNYGYGANLVTWQKDVQAGSNAITGRKGIIPFLFSQGCYTFTGFQQLATAMANPLTHTLVGPEYNLPHQNSTQIAAGANALHLTAAGQRINGAYIAKAYARRILCGLPWLPLVPASVTVLYNQLIVDYVGAVGSIAIDTSLVSDPGNSGFAFTDVIGTAIIGVTVTGPAQITIQLSQPPALSGTRTLTYANIGAYGPNAQMGPLYGPRGCIRDSDPAVSFFAETNPVSDATTITAAPIALHNYGVAFSLSV